MGPFTTYRSLLYRSLTPIVAFHTVRVSLPKLYCRKLDFANSLSPISRNSLDILMGRVTGNTVSFMNASIDIASSLFLFLEIFSFPFFSNLAKSRLLRHHSQKLSARLSLLIGKARLPSRKINRRSVYRYRRKNVTITRQKTSPRIYSFHRIASIFRPRNIYGRVSRLEFIPLLHDLGDRNQRIRVKDRLSSLRPTSSRRFVFPRKQRSASAV